MMMGKQGDFGDLRIGSNSLTLKNPRNEGFFRVNEVPINFNKLG
jgi:hypothetical protein